MAAPWTREERIFLKRNYNVLPIEELEKILGKSAIAIRNQVYYLRKRGWSFKEYNVKR